MNDRQTATWWQHAEGKAIAGQPAGSQLALRPVTIIAWSVLKADYPEGKVLCRDTGYSRSYGRNPWGRYDDINQPPFLYEGPQTPAQLPPMARVLSIDTGDEAVAYPYQILEEMRVVNSTVGVSL